MRDCAKCGHELEPFFDSTCEPPVAWLCQGCASVTLEEDIRSLSQSARRELGWTPTMRPEVGIPEAFAWWKEHRS